MTLDNIYGIRNKNERKKMVYFILLNIFALDQLTKLWVLNTLSSPYHIPVFPGFNLILTYNTGVSFSMLSGNNPYLLILFSLIVCCILTYWLIHETNRWVKISIAMIIGGALGNVVDRILYGGVIDFLDFYIGPYHWPAFNLADTAICLGTLIIIGHSFLIKQETKK